MRSEDIIQQLKRGKLEGKEFIKWWRKENDFSDYELVDSYLKNVDKAHELENFELLDINQMWEVLKRWNPKGIRRSKSTKSDTIEWQHVTKDGRKHTYTCPYNAHSIMSIFDAETRGDTIN
jgi:hypothetical protein